METVRMRPRRQSGGWLKWVVLTSGIVAAAAGMWLGWQRLAPNNTEVKPEYGAAHPILFHGQVAEGNALVNQDIISLPLSFIHDQLGLKEEVYYEAKTGSIVLTNANKVLRMKTNALTATINKKPYPLRIAAQVKDDAVYLPITPLEELYGLHAEYNAQDDIITILRAGDAVQRGVVHDDAVIRRGATIKEPIVDRLANTDIVRIWGEKDGWYTVQSIDGILGYVRKQDIELTETEQIKHQIEPAPFTAWKVVGSKINLTWEAVYEKAPDTDQISEMPGVNVVSPTWFELLDGEGNIRSKADMHYVKWAQNRGMQVWAVFSNGFEPERTTAALAKADTRLQMIHQLAAFAQMYKLKGINLDFENVNTSDKANLVQFVRELTPIMHEQNVVVSIDVTPKSNSEMWSLFLDRGALGKVVDYMMIMAYDEHWASSPTSGSVASLPWTEQSLSRIIEEDGVPANKIVLGMPLYARLWTEKKDDSGKVKVSSKALGMETVKSIINERKLKPTFDADSGQNYVEYEDGGALQRIWIEDGVSIKARTALAKKYGIAGVATWQRQFQSDDIWAIIHQSLTKLP
ncbi:glycosyl hydrolase family 18 protein [Paenibacillus sp. BC26]|uniref:glycosyl hydrolase family 18 protein n=1 Tax=Paenibacillus sp. BC26 TaxID=1881032 RepID=UPI0008DF7CDB|nr:glycosyl hydrolase family 18 protein [Paenibacillus sp. BC26]SFT17135.1 Spore germination protein YaaH [Paenibacillus sp. BC26]